MYKKKVEINFELILNVFFFFLVNKEVQIKDFKLGFVVERKRENSRE